MDITNWRIERTTSSNIPEENKSYEETTKKEKAVDREKSICDKDSVDIRYHLKQLNVREFLVHGSLYNLDYWSRPRTLDICKNGVERLRVENSDLMHWFQSKISSYQSKDLGKCDRLKIVPCDTSGQYLFTTDILTFENSIKLMSGI